MIEYLKMGKKPALFIIVLLINLIPTLHYGDEIKKWTDNSFNIKKLVTDRIMWPDKSRIKGFYPLGFSKDGWFAYSESSGEIELTEPQGGCSKLPCYAIFIFNIQCEEKCSGDIDATAGKKCQCFFGVNLDDMAKFGIQPLKNPLYSTFPAQILDDELNIEFVFKEKAIYPEIKTRDKNWVPEFPETSIYLISQKYGRKKIGSIDHNHTGIIPGVRPAGWIKSPFSHHIVILILCGRYEYDVDKGYVTTFFLRPSRAHLKHGFVKK